MVHKVDMISQFERNLAKLIGVTDMIVGLVLLWGIQEAEMTLDFVE